MEIPNYNSDKIYNEDVYKINWNDIENTDFDRPNYLSNIGNFFA